MNEADRRTNLAFVEIKGKELKYNGILAVPIFYGRGREAVEVIAVDRSEKQDFLKAHVKLVQTLADMTGCCLVNRQFTGR